MTSAVSVLSFIAGLAVLGAFVDFLLGKKGQARVRARLEEVWIRTSYVPVRAFGKAEATAAVQLLDRYFGSSLLSRRRLVAMVTCAAISLAIGFLAPAVLLVAIDAPIEIGLQQSFWLFYILSLVLFSLSIQVTRVVLIWTASKMGTAHTAFNLLLAFSGLFVVYAATCVWAPALQRGIYLSPIVEDAYSRYYAKGDDASRAKAKYVFGRVYNAVTYDLLSIDALKPSALARQMRSIFWENMDEGAIYRKDLTVGVSPAGASSLLGYISGLLRVLFFGAFAASCLVPPTRDAILLLWARALESEKPVFTLTFGAFGALLKLIEQFVKFVM